MIIIIILIISRIIILKITITDLIILVIKQIGLPLRGRPILLITLWLQTELDSTQSCYHYL